MKDWVQIRLPTSYTTVAATSPGPGRVTSRSRKVMPSAEVRRDGPALANQAWRMLLDNYAAVRRHVLSTGTQQGAADLIVRDVDQMRCEQHDIEALAQAEILNNGLDGVRAADVSQHLRGLINGDNRVAKRSQGAGDAAGAAAELKDGCAAGNGGLDNSRVIAGRQQRVEVNRASVGR